MNHQEVEPVRAHDAWADYYDCVYKLTHGELYQGFTDLTLHEIGKLVDPPARIVDFGAGTGRLAIPLAQMGYRVTVVEASAGMCRVLRAKAAPGVEGAVVAPCTFCQRTSVPTKHGRPVEIAVCNQSICEQIPDSRFDLGLCVFTVLNYSAEEGEIHQFARVAANAIRPGGQLLVSFVADMAPMMGRFNAHLISGSSPDGRCRAVRNMNIRRLSENLYEYDEKSELTKDGRTFSYSDRFPLREWSREEIIKSIEAVGFSQQEDLTHIFSATGETYLLFSRNSPEEKRPAIATETMGESARDFIKRKAPERAFEAAGKRLSGRKEETQRQRDAQLILENIQEHRVFFYPGAGCDWEPLHRLTHLCDTFVFCDWGVPAEVVTGNFGLPGLTREFIISLNPDTVAYLSDPLRLPDGGHRVEPWGKYGRLTRTVGNVTRTFHFFYLGMDGITTFINLFAPARIAPKVIYLWFGCDGQDFHDWNGRFGKLVQRCETRPTHVIGCGGPGSTWPYPRLWEELPGWHNLYVAQDYQPPP